MNIIYIYIVCMYINIYIYGLSIYISFDLFRFSIYQTHGLLEKNSHPPKKIEHLGVSIPAWLIAEMRVMEVVVFNSNHL